MKRLLWFLYCAANDRANQAVEHRAAYVTFPNFFISIAWEFACMATGAALWTLGVFRR